MKLNIRVKLLGSFLIVTALLVVICLISINKMSIMGHQSSNMKNTLIPSIFYSEEIKGSLFKLRGDLLKIVIETDPTLQVQWSNDIQSDLDKIKESYTAYVALPATPDDLQQQGVYAANIELYLAMVPEMVKSNLNKDASTLEKSQAILTAHLPYLQKSAGAIERIIEISKKGTDNGTSLIESSYNSGRLMIIIASVIAVIVAIMLALIISQSFVNSVTKVLSVMVKIAGGDLRENVDITSRDEFGKLAFAVNDMIASLRKLIGGTMESSQSVAAASQEISATTEEIANASQSQAQAAQIMNELTQELARAIDEVARNAEQVSELSTQTKRGAEEGGKAVRDSSIGMNKLSEKMGLVEQDSQKIGEIIEVIDEIAEQTNLLALNAAIEAARAGEQGRGFAVVADEVRKLAERSSEATKQIAHIIRGMQLNTVQSVQAVSEASLLSDKTGVLIEGIVSRVNETTQQIAGIAAACEEQAAQSNEVLRSIESIAAASEESAAAAEETAASSQMLAKLADELNESVSTFKI